MPAGLNDVQARPNGQDVWNLSTAFPVEGIDRTLERRVANKRPAEWSDEALCLRARPGLFFSLEEDDVAEALAICRRCRVRGPCLSYAVAHGERFGVWGGTTERERRRMIRAADASTSARPPAA